jgi:hypothetical protein
MNSYYVVEDAIIFVSERQSKVKEKLSLTKEEKNKKEQYKNLIIMMKKN